MNQRTLIVASDAISSDVARSLIRYGILGTPHAKSAFFLIVAKPNYFNEAYLEHLCNEPFACNLLTSKRQLPANLVPVAVPSNEPFQNDAFTPCIRDKIWPKRLGFVGDRAKTFANRMQAHHIRFRTIEEFLKQNKIERLILTHEIPGNDTYYLRLAALSLDIPTVLIPTKVPWIHGVEKHRINASSKRSGYLEYLIFRFMLGRWVSRRYDRDFALRLSVEECVYLKFWHPSPRNPFANGTLPYDEVWLRNQEKLDAWKPVLHPRSKAVIVGHPHELTYASLARNPELRQHFLERFPDFSAKKPTICVFVPSDLNKLRKKYRSLDRSEIAMEYAKTIASLASQKNLNVFVCPHPSLAAREIEQFSLAEVPIVRDRAASFLPFLDGSVVDASSSLVDELESLSTILLIWDVYDNGGPLMTQPYLDWDESLSAKAENFSGRVLNAQFERPDKSELGMQILNRLEGFLS